MFLIRLAWTSKIFNCHPVLYCLRLKLTAWTIRIILVSQRGNMRMIACMVLLVPRVWWSVTIREIYSISESRLIVLFALKQFHVSQILQIIIIESFLSLKFSLIPSDLILDFIFAWLTSSIVRRWQRRALAIILVVLVVSSTCPNTCTSLVVGGPSHVTRWTS